MCDKEKKMFFFSLIALLYWFCLKNVCDAYRNETQADRFSEMQEAPILSVQLAYAVFKRQYLNRVTVMTGQCSQWKLIRMMMTQIQTSIVTPTTLWRLDHTYFRTGILAYLHGCPETTAIFQQAVQPYVNSSYRWLIVSEQSSDAMRSLLEGLTFRLDTSMTVALRQGQSYSVLDVYKDTTNAVQDEPVGQFDLDTLSLSQWVDAENAPFRSRVDRTLETGVLIVNLSSWKKDDTLKRFELLRGHPQVPATYFAMKEFHVYRAISELYNITTNVHLYSVSGYPNEYDVFSGMLGDIQTEKLELSSMKVMITHVRMKAVDFLNMCDPFSLSVIYYVSQSLDTPTALFQPFSPALWGCVVAVSTLLILGLFCVGHREMRSDRIDTDLSLTTAVLVVLGTFNGQGHPVYLKWYSTRNILAAALITGFVLASAYSAVITRSLLSDPAPSIRTRAEYMRNPLKMAVENYYHFTRAIFSDQMEGPTRVLYDAKIRPPIGGGFRQVGDAFQGVLKQRWAMFAQINNIHVEMSKATPQQVCRLAWIHQLDDGGPLCPIVKRRSDLKNLLSRGFVPCPRFPLAQERGLHDREKRRHHASPIPCLAQHKRQWAPVKIQIVQAAVFIMLAGVLLGLLVCIVESLTTTRLMIRPSFSKRSRASKSPLLEQVRA